MRKFTVEAPTGSEPKNGSCNSGDLLRREALLFREWMTLLTRDLKKYFTITAAMYAGDCLGITQGIRPTYFACRALDDIADGDRTIDGCGVDVSSLLAALHQQLDTDSRDASVPCSYLLHDAVHSLGSEANREEVIQNFHTFLDTTLIDFQRRVHKTVFTVSELDAHYMRSFQPVLNLALIALGSRSRAQALGLLPLLQGKVYALDDMSHELPRGEINIPGEVVNRAGLDVENLMRCPTLSDVPAIRDWMKDECDSSTQILKDIESQQYKDKGVRRILGILLPSIRRFLNTSSFSSNHA